MTGFLLYNKLDIFRSEEHRARPLCFFIAMKLREMVFTVDKNELCSNITA